MIVEHRYVKAQKEDGMTPAFNKNPKSEDRALQTLQLKFHDTAQELIKELEILFTANDFQSMADKLHQFAGLSYILKQEAIGDLANDLSHALEGHHRDVGQIYQAVKYLEYRLDESLTEIQKPHFLYGPATR